MKVELWVLLSAFTFSYCKTIEKLSQNPCNGKFTCHECIQAPTCGWCADPKHDIKHGRCFIQSEGCQPDYFYIPDNVYTMLENRKLSQGTRNFSSSSGSFVSTHEESGSSSSGHFHHHKAVLFSPQRVKLKLRIKEKYRIKVSYIQAEDYPVDLYYLMDLSKSMEDEKDKLSILGDLLAKSMQNITSNFRVGLGSFVHNVVMPYESVVSESLIEPCTRCQAPYSYQNIMSLSTDTSRFAREVRRAAVSANLDAPEGGFDAIMQAVVCREQIGWRQKARRLIVFSTNAGFHAGDGKLGGMVKPNDGLCHLDWKGSYTHSTLQDYPSISQINQKLKQNSINLIFAVTSEQLQEYQKLQKYIEGSSVGQLSNDSANVVDLVKEQYNKITSSVELKDNTSDKLNISYFSNCLDGTGPLIETNKCNRLKVGTVVKFEAEIEVKSCPGNKSEWTQTFQIYPVGINESLTVNLEMICDCACESKGEVGYKEKAEECNGLGTYQCGVCKCDSSRYGLKCECDEITSQKHGVIGCRPDNITKIDCSGRGQCICGQCVCDSRQSIDEKIEGMYCECDNFSCDRENGLLCSGVDHGICECGQCVCNSGWTGPACGCHTSVDSCVPPGGGEVCSGKGFCECGVCKCNTEEDGGYSGRYCEMCPTCPGRCMELKHCIQCQVYKSGPLSEEECAANCTSFVPVIVDVVKVDESSDQNVCSYFDDEDCRYTYVYAYDEKGKLVVQAQKELECPSHAFNL